jgi:hypothetical protein
MRTKRSRIYAASALVAAAFAGATYVGIAESSGSTVATHLGRPTVTAPAPTHSVVSTPPVVTPAPVVSPPPRAGATPQPPAVSGIPQGGGGDGDPDNFGAPSDGDGDV